jgi:hypothetical protein
LGLGLGLGLACVRTSRGSSMRTGERGGGRRCSGTPAVLSSAWVG